MDNSQGKWQDWKLRYDRARIETIPLAANTKRPLYEHWQQIPGDWQWEKAKYEGKDRGNLGILCGPKGLAVIDCDSPAAIHNVESVLSGLGLAALPYVVTPSKGRHYYLRVAHAPNVFNAPHLPSAIGAGEFRIRNCQVVAPSSKIGKIYYSWRGGGPEKLATLPPVEWRDLVTLHPIERPTAATYTPLKLIRRDMPYEVAKLLKLLQTAPKGQIIIKPTKGKYDSRSAAESAVVAILALSGWQYGEILGVFESWQPGHYRDICHHSEHAAGDICPLKQRYFETTYHNATSTLAANPERAMLAEWYHAASEAPWPGRGGGLDKLVYQGIASIGWQFASPEVYAAERDLAQYAGASRGGVQKSLKRLTGQIETAKTPKVLEKTAPPIKAGQMAARYMVSPPVFHKTSPQVTSFESVEKREVEQQPPSGAASEAPQRVVRANEPKNNQFSAVLSGELWHPDLLGRSAGLLYSHLDDKPMRPDILADKTDKHRNTVDTALKRLAEYHLAAKIKGGWVRGPADPAEVARGFNVEGREQARRDEHNRQRQAYADLLPDIKAGKLAKKPRDRRGDIKAALKSLGDSKRVGNRPNSRPNTTAPNESEAVA